MRPLWIEIPGTYSVVIPAGKFTALAAWNAITSNWSSVVGYLNTKLKYFVPYR